ncbi:hypothetical protein [Streptomyces avidinii]
MPGTVSVPLDPPPRARLRSAARLAVCAAVPWFLCLWWGTSTVPVPAALPAVLILREDVYDAPRRGRDRLVGVVVGVALTTFVLHWLPPPTGSSVTSVSWAASVSFLAVLACGCAGMYLMYRGGAPNQQVLITALVIYATAVPGYALARLAESAVGIAAVVLLGPLLWPPDPYRSAAAGLDTYRGGLDGLLGTVAARLGAGGPPTARGTPEDAQLWLRPRNGLAACERAARRTRLPRLTSVRPPGRRTGWRSGSGSPPGPRSPSSTSPRNSGSAPGPTAPLRLPRRTPHRLPGRTPPCATSPLWSGPPPGPWTPPCAARTVPRWPRTSTAPAAWTSPTARPTPPGTTPCCDRAST